MYRSEVPLSSIAAGALAATFLFVSVFLGAGQALARDRGLRGPASDDTMTTIPPSPAPAPVMHADPDTRPDRTFPSPRRPLPSIPPYTAPPQPGDDIAVLEAIEIALTEASDGSTYVWRRDHGRLAGAFRPTSTFRDADGRMCRHLELRLRLGSYQRTIEGIACRARNGVWQLEG